jgi:hypothetical protein
VLTARLRLTDTLSRLRGISQDKPPVDQMFSTPARQG